MIALRAVERRFGRGRRSTRAVAGVSLEVSAGSVVGFVGPNGAGKSTLFGLILGFIAPTSGEVCVEESDPRQWVRANGAGWLPDRFELPAEWRVADVLRGFARLEGVRDTRASAAAALARFGLDRHAAKPVNELSRGLLQRVGLAQALLAPHRLVVLDEPAQGLDPMWRIRLRDEIGVLRQAGVTVLLASHDLAEVERVADRVVVLDAGRVVEQVELGGAADAARWAIAVEGAADGIGEIFPGAVAADDGDWVVEAAGAADLSVRLAALLARGVVVRRVEPVGPDLEARVRERLERGEG